MKPILFNTEMLKAVIDGRKTQTRRVVKSDFHSRNIYNFHGDEISNRFEYTIIGHSFPTYTTCPYGKVGDRLWVGETFCIDEDMIFFKADNTFKPYGLKWKPSIFMPRKASRITLEITDIRVERIKDTTIEDIKKEGVQSMAEKLNLDKELSGVTNGHKWQWIYLWDSINKKRGYGWDTNCWVWVIVFKVVKK